jgi:hypothetical protein
VCECRGAIGRECYFHRHSDAITIHRVCSPRPGPEWQWRW